MENCNALMVSFLREFPLTDEQSSLCRDLQCGREASFLMGMLRAERAQNSVEVYGSQEGTWLDLKLSGRILNLDK